MRFVASFEELEKSVHESKTNFGFVFKKNGKDTFVLLETKITDLAVAMFQPVLDEVVKNDEYERYVTYDELYNHSSCEFFNRHFTTPSGDQMVAWGYFGYDG